MYHHFHRPTPVVCALAGSLCTVGVVGIIARALDNFTDYTLHQSLELPSFLIAVFGTAGGGVWIGWLIVRTLRAEVRQLRAENAELRADRDKFDDLLEAVKVADQQGEINGIRLKKCLDLVRQILGRQIADEDTQDIPRLHSIPGGGA